jgi:hypothetical protein
MMERVLCTETPGHDQGQNARCGKQKTATKGPTEEELIIYVPLIAEWVHSW